MDIQVFDFEDSINDPNLVEHHEWGLMDRTVIREELTVDVVLHDVQRFLVYPYLKFTFLFERKPEFFEKNVIVPTALICALSTIAFLLPNESGEKITFSVTVFLALCVNLLVVANHIPASSESYPIIGHYYIACIILVAISIFMTTIILSFHFKGEHMHLLPIPYTLKKIMFNYVAPLLCFEMSKTLQRAYSKIARARKVSQMRKRKHKFSTFETRKTKSSFSMQCSVRRKKSKIVLSCTEINAAESTMLPEDIKFRQIIDTLVKVESSLREAAIETAAIHQRNILSEEWKLFSRILDRLAAIAYGLTTTAFTIYFMYSLRCKPEIVLPEPYFVANISNYDVS